MQLRKESLKKDRLAGISELCDSSVEYLYIDNLLCIYVCIP